MTHKNVPERKSKLMNKRWLFGKDKKEIYNQKEKKSKAVFKAADFLEEGRIAFLDSEYVTSQKKGGPPAKLVSLGMVICRENFEEVERFHSYIYNDEPLHDKFRELTGITGRGTLAGTTL